MSARLTLGVAAALASLGAVSRRGSRSDRPGSVLADVSGYPDCDSVPPSLPLLRFPDGQVLTSSSLLDRADGEADSELGWMLFHYGNGQRAQARLDKLGRWLDGLRAPLTLWRGLNVPLGEGVRRGWGAEGNQHWTPDRNIALAFAYGSDWGPWMPEELPLAPGRSSSGLCSRTRVGSTSGQPSTGTLAPSTTRSERSTSAQGPQPS